MWVLPLPLPPPPLPLPLLPLLAAVLCYLPACLPACCGAPHAAADLLLGPLLFLPADGVTSSGKTHTMMGSDSEPGMVPHAISEVFRLIQRTSGKEFLLRMSMMEIYNEVGGRWAGRKECSVVYVSSSWNKCGGTRHQGREGWVDAPRPDMWHAWCEVRGDACRGGCTGRAGGELVAAADRHPALVPHLPASLARLLQVLNDLLDASRTNLKLREDTRKGGGITIDGIREETLVSAEHALQVIAMGNEQRKVGGPTAGGRARGGAWGGSASRLASGRQLVLPSALLSAPGHACVPRLTPSACRPACPVPCVQTSATAFNEGSSRSHTIIRITIEASGG